MSDADDAIRRAFEQAAASDPPVDTSGVADAVRSGTPTAPKGGSWFRGWIGGVAGVGAVCLVGAAVAGATGAFASDPTPVTMNLDAVTTYSCPGSGVVGALHRGDRVLSVAPAPRTASGWPSVHPTT